MKRRDASRRDFLKSGGALVVGFSSVAALRRRSVALRAGAVRARRINGVGSSQLDSWIAIGADGSVTAYTGKCELGQGIFTAQTQLVAEELVGAVRSRHADSVRHRACRPIRARPRAASRTRRTSTRPTSRRPARPRARRCCSWPPTRLGVPVDQLTVVDGVDRRARRRRREGSATASWSAARSST